MKNYDFGPFDYDPSEHRSDWFGVYSGFSLFAVVFIGLFLI